MMKLFIARIVICIVSIFLILGGILLKMHILPAMIKSQIYKNLDLREGTEGYKAFIEPPAPVYLSYRMFNIENPREVTSGGVPKLREVGPYSYREVMVKEDVVEHNSRRLSYGKHTTFIFDEKNTEKLKCVNVDGNPCTKDDEITILNPVLLTFANLLGGLPEGLASFFYEILNNGNEHFKIDPETLFITDKVDTILYSGFKSNSALILENIEQILGSVLEALSITAEFGNIIKLISPAQLSGGTFAFFKGKNDTKLKNYYTIENGRFDKESFMNIIEFNGQSQIPDSWWPDVAPSITGQLSGEGGSCHKLQGTDGTQFPPFLFEKKNFPLWMFVGELCRSIYVEYESEVEVEGGIQAYRYGVGKRVFSMSNPENFCYCKDFFSCAKRKGESDEWDLSGCNKCKDGILDVSSCYGAPIFMSQPHFLKADKDVQAFVDGLSPDPETHSTYIDLEPHLGTPLRAHKKIQINMGLSKVKGIEVMKNLPDFIIVPMFWADEGAEVDSKKADELNGLLFTPMSAGNIAGIVVGYVLGPLLMVIFILLSIYEEYRLRKDKLSSEQIVKQP